MDTQMEDIHNLTFIGWSWSFNLGLLQKYTLKYYFTTYYFRYIASKIFDWKRNDLNAHQNIHN